MKVSRQIIMIKYWIKILSSKETTLIYRVYNMLKNDTDNGVTYGGSNWAFQIKQILDYCGMSQVWQNQLNYPVNFLSIKQRIIDMYHQSWYAGINNSNRLETYSIFKHEFNMESYLDFIREKRFRFSLSRFRTSSHQLIIETGRYNNIPRGQRLCTNCCFNLIENEYHFLMVCPKYRDLRIQYFKRYYCHWPNMHKFENLLSSSSKHVIENVAKFIYYANSIRT